MNAYERRQLTEAANTILKAQVREKDADELARRARIEREWEEREYQAALSAAAAKR